MMRWLSIFSLVFLVSPFASEGARRSSKKSQKVIDVNFDDELHIKGKLLGPSIFTLYQKKNLNYGKLIKPRKNFLPEMRETLGDIQ